MNTYTMQRLILEEEALGMTDKLIGMAYSLHLCVATQTIRVKQSTIAKECGCSRRTVLTALKNLVRQGVFASRVTGRAAVVEPGEKLLLRYAVKQASQQKCKLLHNGPEIMTTRGEEEYKRELHRARMENEGRQPMPRRKRGVRKSA